MAFILLSLKHP